MFTWKFSEHIILCKWAYLFLWICPLFRQNPQKKWRNSHNYHVIIFYIIYVDNLIENIFRAVSFFLHFVQLKSCSLFWVTSDSIRWIFSTGIWCREKHLYSNILHFFERRAKKFSLASSRKIPRLKMFARLSKKCRKFGNKCISRHQIPVEKNHLIESEVTQNKEQLFNCQNVKKNWPF